MNGEKPFLEKLVIQKLECETYPERYAIINQVDRVKRISGTIFFEKQTIKIVVYLFIKKDLFHIIDIVPTHGMFKDLGYEQKVLLVQTLIEHPSIRLQWLLS